MRPWYYKCVEFCPINIFALTGFFLLFFYTAETSFDSFARKVDVFVAETEVVSTFENV